MSTSTACFDFVIGLSRTDCECFGTPPADYDVSNSDLFLDETSGLNLKKIFSAAGCENDGWDIMEKAREHGVKRMRDEVVKGVVSETKWKRAPLTAQIGDMENSSGTVRLPKAYHGIELVLPHHAGGTATIRRIGGAFKFAGSVTVNIYSEDSEDPIQTEVITATTNKLAWTDITPLVLDMDAGGAPYKRYWFLFEPTDGQQALNSRIHCGCGGTPTWSCSAPWWSHFPTKMQEWYRWSMANGTYGDTMADRADWVHNNATQGLLLSVDFKCDARTALCYGTPDYAQDPLQATFAWGVQYAAAVWVLDYVSGSTGVNRQALADGDETARLRLGYEKEFKSRVDYMVQELSEPPDEGNSTSGVNTYSDCFTCKDVHGIQVQTIRR